MRKEICKKRLQLMKRANTKIRELTINGVSYNDERIQSIQQKLEVDLSKLDDFCILGI